jgi:hypothetical protein
MKNKKLTHSSLIIFLIIAVTSCAPSGYESSQAGFFSGIWHGFIIMFSLIGKLFGADIGIYAANNSEFLYWLGFLFGIGAFGGGGYSSAR